MRPSTRGIEAREALAESRDMAVDERTMFEIFRETDYNRTFHSIFYTDLEEHGRDSQIAKAAAGETVFTGFLADATKEDARTVIEAIVDELNDLGEDVSTIGPQVIEGRLRPFLADRP